MQSTALDIIRDMLQSFLEYNYCSQVEKNFNHLEL